VTVVLDEASFPDSGKNIGNIIYIAETGGNYELTSPPQPVLPKGIIQKGDWGRKPGLYDRVLESKAKNLSEPLD